MVFPTWITQGPMTLLKVGWIAARYDTEMAHAAIRAVAEACAGEGRPSDDTVGNFSEPGIAAIAPC